MCLPCRQNHSGKGSSDADLAPGRLKVNKNNFGADAANRLTEFGLAVSQANSALKALQSARMAGCADARRAGIYRSRYDQIDQYVAAWAGRHGARREARDLCWPKKISSAAGSLVLVAGSIFYQKPNGRSSSALTCARSCARAFRVEAYKDV